MVRPLLGERSCETIDAFLRCSKRYGYCTDDTPTISELFAAADQSLFERVLRNKSHVLQPLLPEKKMISNCNLRPCQHDRQLIRKSAHINDSFLLWECCSETLINCHCDFNCVFRIFLLFISAPCTLVAIVNWNFYTNIWIWIFFLS